MPDGKSVFKIHYISIMGRDKPELYEWEHSPFTQLDFEQFFLSGAHEGIGFVTAFPHISKIFRFSPYADQQVRAADTAPRTGIGAEICYLAYFELEPTSEKSRRS